VVRRVQMELGCAAATPVGPHCRFADVLDSMGLVEFLMVLADDCGITPAAVETCVGHRFGTVAELAAAMHAAGLARQAGAAAARPLVAHGPHAASAGACWLATTAVRLPTCVQSAATLNGLLQRPPGWLEAHAGIVSRRVWGEQDPVAEAAAAAR